MKDSLTLSYINMYGILGALEDLCRLSPQARSLVEAALPAGKTLRLGFEVSGGPAMTLVFAGGDGRGGCRMEIGRPADCHIKLPFSTPEKFNGMIDGTVTPFPSRGFTKIGFLTKTFTGLTDILETYLRPEAAALEDPAFFAASTEIMFFLIVRTLAQIGSHDKIGRFTAGNIPDGIVALSIKGGGAPPLAPDLRSSATPPSGGAAPATPPPLRGAVVIRDHKVDFTRDVPENFHAIMEFSDIRLARKLFDGEVSALGCVGQGLISMRGNLGMLDTVNRLLDRVAVYLA
jgi:hypothetical protein